MRLWLLFCAASGFLAVGFGAFGAHALASRISDTDLAAFQTGVQYHLIHTLALGLVALATSQPSLSQTAITTAGWAFLAGIILFSGSLYFLGFTGSRALVLVTPLGGLAFLTGWACLFWAALSRNSQ